MATLEEREEVELVEALRAGDEAAFRALVDRYHASMVRLAMSFVSTRATAEEVTQEAWLGVLRGLDRFEGRSSLRTWIFRILANTAKTRAVREGRQVPFSALATQEDEPAVDPSRFLGPESRWSDHWGAAPTRWETIPDASLLSAELRARIDEAIAALPDMQRRVITLRDIEGWGSESRCSRRSS